MSSNPKINRLLGERLKETRIRKGMTREFLAEKIDVSSRFLADVENGKVGISLLTLTKICKLLGISADYLLGITRIDESERNCAEIIVRLRQLDTKYLPYVNDVIIAFANAMECD